MEKKLSLGQSLIIFAFLVVSIFFGVVSWGLDPHIPLVMTTIFAAIISVINGIKWSDLENSIVKAINSINQPILIILIISMMMGAWLLSGIVPTMIYYSFKLNITAADQFMAIIFPGKMYKEEYKKRNIDLKVLFRTVEDAGTVTSSLVPWATCGAFMTVTLGVHPLQYLPYAIFNWLCPILAIIYGYTNFKIAYTDKTEKEQTV